MALCAAADVERYLGLDSGTLDATVAAAFIADAQDVIENYIGRDLETANRSETLDGDGHDELLLTYWPVTSITTVTENGTTLTVTTDYLWYTDGRLTRVSGGYPTAWTHKRKAVTVTYVGGYTTVPYDLRSVCARITARFWQAANAHANVYESAAGVKQEQIGHYSATYDRQVGDVTAAALLTDEDRLILDRYRGPGA